jgi:DNA-binding NarL/FixJ family response regulator
MTLKAALEAQPQAVPARSSLPAVPSSPHPVIDPPDPQLKRRRILIVDDQPVCRKGIGLLMKDEPDLVACGEAGDTRRALELARPLHPDLVVVSLGAPGASGLDLIKALAERHPDIRLLMLSAYDENVYAERALNAGAHGYIMKNQPVEEVFTAIRRVLGGKLYLSEAMADRLLSTLTGGKRVFISPLSRLTNRERQVYELIGRGLRRREIARQLMISPKTVETYRAKLKEKLGLANGLELVRSAMSWCQRL